VNFLYPSPIIHQSPFVHPFIMVK